MDETSSGDTTKLRRFSENQYASIRGAFIYALMILQERVEHVEDAENRLVSPTIKALDWNPERDFWRGTVVTNDGTKPSASALAPHITATRILLHMHTHWLKLGLDLKAVKEIELGLTDILELGKAAYGPARLAFTKKEQGVIRTRIRQMFGTKNAINNLSTKEAEVVRFYLSPGSETETRR